MPMGRADVLLAVVSAALPWSGSACDVLALADTHPSPYLHAVYTRSGSANGRPDYAYTSGSAALHSTHIYFKVLEAHIGVWVVGATASSSDAPACGAS